MFSNIAIRSLSRFIRAGGITILWISHADVSARFIRVGEGEDLAWIESQFEALGRRNDKRALALHLLSALQGVSLLANNFHDPDMVVLEGDHLKAWIAELETSAVREAVG